MTSQSEPSQSLETLGVLGVLVFLGGKYTPVPNYNRLKSLIGQDCRKNIRRLQARPLDLEDIPLGRRQYGSPGISLGEQVSGRFELGIDVAVRLIRVVME